MRRPAHRPLLPCAALAAAMAVAFSAGMCTPVVAAGTADVADTEATLSADLLHAGGAAEAAVILRIEPGWHVNAHKPGLEYLIATKLEVAGAPGVEVGEIVYPEPVVRTFEFAETALPVYEGQVAIRFPVRAAPGAAPGPRRLVGALTEQACSHNLCLAPAKLPVVFELRIAEGAGGATDAGADAGAARPADASAADGGAASSEAEGTPAAGTSEAPSAGTGEGAGAGEDVAAGAGGQIAGLVARRGWGLTLGVIFLAGLGLNLTPCVYPLIPITISYFGAQTAGGALPRLVLAGLYVSGLAITYSSLGVAAALTGSLLGASLQSPWVLGGIAALMVALALSFFGLYEIRLPSAITMHLGSRRGALGALFMGLTIGLVAAPCVGPFVIPLLAYVGATGDPWQGFWMFMALSLGLGAPYLFLALGAASIARLPRAGEWMVGVKHVFGVALLAMAAYFASPLLPKRLAPWPLPGFLLLATLYLAFFERAAQQVRGFRIFRLACAGAAFAMALAIGWPAPPGIAWQPYSAEAVEQARASGRPVIIDFTADWCLPCKELDRITFRTKRVVEAAAGFVALKADVTQFTAKPVEELRRQYDVLGVPTVLFLDAAGREPRHLRVTGYIGPSDFHARLSEVLAGTAPQAGAEPQAEAAGTAPQAGAEPQAEAASAAEAGAPAPAGL